MFREDIHNIGRVKTSWVNAMSFERFNDLQERKLEIL
jgi:hypothetical protein